MNLSIVFLVLAALLSDHVAHGILTKGLMQFISNLTKKIHLTRLEKLSVSKAMEKSYRLVFNDYDNNKITGLLSCSQLPKNTNYGL